MIFWRKKKNDVTQEREEAEDKIIHHPSDPAIEPSTDDDADLSSDQKHELEETETEIVEDLAVVPVSKHTRADDAKERAALADHTADGGWLSRLTKGLAKSSGKLGQGIADLVTKKKLDQATLERLEELLIEADLGPKTAAKLVADFSKDRFGKELSETDIRAALADSVAKILDPVAIPMAFEREDGSKPFVVMMVGVNGVGKTTTIGKIAHQLHYTHKKKVMIAAGDTFRAAAIEQLQEWARRSNTPLVANDIGSDAAAVAFESFERAKKENVDVLLIDTAGRLHNKSNLMAELEKIVRVLKKQDASLPHAVLLVLDATTGQNAHAQVEIFKQAVNVTGLVVTKLDGTARGGVVVGLADSFGVPIHLIGVGEGIEDLQPFHPQEFARALVGVEG